MPRGPGKKRKITDIDIEDKFQTKKRKIEQKQSEYQEKEEIFEEDSDLSENDEPLDYLNIEDFLAPQEKEFIRKDPYNLDFTNTIWTNDFTQIKAKSEFMKWMRFSSSYNGDFPPELYQNFIYFCDIDTLYKWRRVCRLTNALVIQSQQLWRDLFYSRGWLLRHDIENIINTDIEQDEIDPRYMDKGNWKNVIPDEQIDWFGEYRRNHINAVAIRKVIEDIKMKLQRIIDDYGVVKQGVEDPAFFNPGATDEDILDYNGKAFPNDIKELLKCCNGARFTMTPIDDRHDEMYTVPYILLPTLDNITKGPFYNAYDRSEYNCGVSGCCKEDLLQPLSRKFDPDIPEKPMTIELDSSDMESNSDEYVISHQSASESDDGTAGSDADPNCFLQEMYAIQEENDKDFNVVDRQYYKVHDGALISAEHYTVYESLVTYLQDISDLLDDKLAVFWLRFDDYAVISKEGCDFDDFQSIVPYEDNRTRLAWVKALNEIINSFGLYNFTQRAMDLLVAATQDTAVKLFQKAQSYDTTDELLPEALQRAIKDFPDCVARNEVPRSSTNSTIRSKRY